MAFSFKKKWELYYTTIRRQLTLLWWCNRGRDCMVVGFTITLCTCAISAYHHWIYEFETRSCRGVLDTTLCDNVCQWLATGRWFSPRYNWNIVESGVKHHNHYYERWMCTTISIKKNVDIKFSVHDTFLE
jgi:hypothetical protein